MTAGATQLLLIGYGFRGRQWEQTCGQRRDVVIAAIADPEPAARTAAADKGINAFEDAEQALAWASFDGAIIATPPLAHVSNALLCLQVGVGVLVEKPLALTLGEATTVAEQAAAAALSALVVQNFRFLPRERAVARGLQTTGLGKPVTGTIRSSRALRADDFLWDFTVHHLDALRVRFGGPPEEVWAERSADRLRISAELRWADGVRVHYAHDDGASGYMYRERLEGSGGVLDVDDQRVRAGGAGGGRLRRVRAGRAPHPDDAVLNEFVAVLRGGSSSLAVADNLLTVATVEAVARAVEQTDSVRVAGV